MRFLRKDTIDPSYWKIWNGAVGMGNSWQPSIPLSNVVSHGDQNHMSSEFCAIMFGTST